MSRFRKKHLAILLLTLTAVFLLILHEALLLPDGKSVLVRFFDVGQGDSALITGPSGQQILIDGGPDLRTLEDLGTSMPFFDRSIDLLILSHPHLDHVASFPQILRRYKIGQVLISGAQYSNGPYEEFLTLLKQEHIPVILPERGKELDLGDHMLVDILWPPPTYFGQPVKKIHDTNVVVKVRYGEDSVLFVGDLEVAGENRFLADKIDVSATVLKVGHHGSRTSTSSGFLLAVDPQLAVVSVAAKNSYGLPDEDVLARISHFGIPYKMTMSGSIVWWMDGKKGL